MALDIVFLGSTGFSVNILEGLLEGGHNVVKVIALADRPAGRGRKLRCTPVKEAARSLPGCILEEYEDYAAVAPGEIAVMPEHGLGVVAAFGKIMPRFFIERFPRGIINVHPSLLPHLRGAAPVQRAIMQGHRLSGVSLAYLDEGIDTGDVIDQVELEIDDADDFLSLENKLAALAIVMLKSNLDLLEKEGRLPRYPQDHSKATYAHPINRDECRIEWSHPDVHIFNLIRGLSPRPGAFATFRGRRLKILSACLTDKQGLGFPGEIEVVGKRDILVQTSSRPLLVNSLQPEGSRVLTAGEFLRGYRIATGEVLNHG